LIGFVSLINALAWPSATIAIAVLFRRELRLALGRLGQVKYGAVEVNFREDLHEAEALARSAARLDPPVAPHPLPKINLEVAPDEAAELVGTMVGREASTATTVLVTAGAKSGPRSRRDLDSYLQLCQKSPRVGVLEAWDELSQALIHAATQLGDRRAIAPVRVESALRFLVDRGWLTNVEGRLVDRLERLSDLVERREGPPMAPEDARRFVELIVPLVHRVANLV